MSVCPLQYSVIGRQIHERCAGSKAFFISYENIIGSVPTTHAVARKSCQQQSLKLNLEQVHSINFN